MLISGSWFQIPVLLESHGGPVAHFLLQRGAVAATLFEQLPTQAGRCLREIDSRRPEIEKVSLGRVIACKNVLEVVVWRSVSDGRSIPR